MVILELPLGEWNGDGNNTCLHGYERYPPTMDLIMNLTRPEHPGKGNGWKQFSVEGVSHYHPK